MNILIVTETYLPYITGVSVSTDNIARYLVSRGHKVTLVCPKPLVKGIVTPLKGLKIIWAKSFPIAFYNLNAVAFFLNAIPLMDKVFRENKFDVVHIQEPVVLGVSTLIKAKKYKVPIVGALHFIPEQVDRVLWGSFEKILTPIMNFAVNKIYNQYDEVVTPSHFFANYLKSVNVKKPINVISNGTDVNKFKPAKLNLSLREKLGFSDNDFVFFFLGRIDRDKNVETLVRAMPYTKENVKLLVIGKGQEKNYLVKLAKEKKVEHKINWIDYISNDDMPNYYHASNAFSIMSPYEGQSIVTLQAAASGLPMIAANAGALPELVEDCINGFLVSTYNYKSLAEKMNQLAGNKELVEKFSKESRRISLPHHRPKVLHKLELIYKKLSQ